MQIVLLTTCISLQAASLDFTKEELESRWAARIQMLLDEGKLPLIDMETSLRKEHIEDYFPKALSKFDEYGIAMMSADGYQRPKDGSKGYRWSDYIIELVNEYPDYFIPTANGGTNKNWLKQKGGKSKHFIDQMEEEINSGKYYSMGEFDFRHYMSSHQCKAGKHNRDNDIPLDGKNGHRVFQLSSDTGVPFVIHLEPEDHALASLEKMLKNYPKAKVIVAHFGQIRHPEKQRRFTPEYARHLLSTYPNLYYDLANGHPNRKYKCAGPSNREVLIGDTVIWEGDHGNQRKKLKPEYKQILADFSHRFVFASDYGSGRPPLELMLEKKSKNFHLIVRDLPDAAKHDIAYKNAWYLLTGRIWDG